MKAKQILLLIIGAIFLIIVLQNTEEILVTFFFWSVTLPKIVVLLISALIGFVAGILIFSITTKRKLKAKELEQKEVG
ncbi:MAG TPA: LapA family protein [Ignavibacteriaceae bacterium]|nr:LapA family protein [Ignavibacteriaceae bacterium]